jgi:heterodisulfide reductase subunit A-like polyferredoxin
MQPGWNPETTFDVPVAEDGFIQLPAFNISPTETRQPGIFAAGTAAGPMDIVDSIMTAGAAASEAAAYMQSHNGRGPVVAAEVLTSTGTAGERSVARA